MKNKKLMVERETYEKDGKTYFTYFIKGVVRGVEARIAVTPPDKGGYTVLDIVFGKEMKADLIAKPYEIKDDATDLTESFFHVFINHVVLPSAIAFLEDKIIYVKNPPINKNCIKNHNQPGILLTILYISFCTSHV